MIKKILFIFSLVASQILYSSLYKDGVEPLFKEHSFLQSKENKACAYWKLCCFYDWQKPATCSLTSVSMVINALRTSNEIEENYTIDEILDLSPNSADWKKDITEPCIGVSLDNLHTYLINLLEKLKINAVVEKIHVNDPIAPPIRDKFLSELKKMNDQEDYYVIVGFVQTDFFRFPPDKYGHFSPLGAYDSVSEKVLIMDVYRFTSEPYWVKVDDLLKSMATLDNSSKEPFPHRGYLVIKKI